MNVSVKNGKLAIEVELRKPQDAPLSSSGKSKLLFSSGGFVTIAQGLKANLTVIFPLKDQ